MSQSDREVGCFVFYLSPHLNPLPMGEEIKAIAMEIKKTAP
jgi:hypothetical protein